MTNHVIDLHSFDAETKTRRLADEPDRVIEGDPRQEIEIAHSDDAVGLRVGRWVSTPGKWHAFTDKDEYCYILRGKCALIHEDGTRQEFGAGASFLIPNGFRGFWEVIETTEKHFVILERD
ncbi:cupin domain-containing protein [Marivita sp. GX14005]|uniref:cupin domain-containing protein n=1 Tax=Marivita sp. GX14005 TaxID=2942276 RepID=UPI0020194D6C|nr:cupin domain-containing protein [Marivita sp. GX14005]MCL3881492.1 cupin domain-containing protein [Marivita sp. GX14005]